MAEVALEDKLKQYPHLEQVASRCGKGSCEFYDKHKTSACSKFEDRRLCALSLQQRKKVANTSKRRPDKLW
jgi:hypothetical protein